MPAHKRVRADIAVNENGVRTVDLVVPKGHREDAFALLARMLPSLRDLDRVIKADSIKGKGHA
jgi:hypothetical protein